MLYVEESSTEDDGSFFPKQFQFQVPIPLLVIGLLLFSSLSFGPREQKQVSKYLIDLEAWFNLFWLNDW